MKKEVKKLTRSGYEKLQKELRHLIDVESVEINAQLSEARAQGDLSENFDFDAARKRKEEIFNRIKEIEETLENAVILDDKVLKTAKKVAEYMIVDTIEADPFKNWISQDCLVGTSLVGKTVGDIVEIKTATPYKVEILEIKYVN